MDKKKRGISISLKINCAMFLLLSIMMAVVVTTYQSTQKVDKQLELLSKNIIPLSNMIANINVLSLKKEVTFDRLLRHYEEVPANKNLITTELKIFEELNKQDAMEIKKAQDLLKTTLQQTAISPKTQKLATIKPLLDLISKKCQLVYENAKKLVLMEENKNQKLLKSYAIKLDDDMDDIDQLLESVLKSLEGMSKKEADKVFMGEVKLHELSLWVAIFTFVVGVIVSPLLTKMIIKPLRLLTKGVGSVAKGDFEIQIPIKSNDEVGVLSDAFNSMVNELKAKEKIKAIFGQYVDPRIVERLLDNQGEVGPLASSKKIMTIFFSDIESFSALSESLTPDTLVMLINEYFSIVSKPINDTRGVIDKFIGDAVMAFWGTPFSDESRHAHDACHAALTQFDCLQELNKRIPDIIGMKNSPIKINIRIGLCTGEVLAGNVGSSGSTSYTVMGDSVNIAARLESANKQYGTRILIDEQTQKLIDPEFEVRQIDIIRVVGIQEPVGIYELLATKNNLTSEQKYLRDQYEKAFKYYQQKDLPSSEESIQKALSINPNDGPSNVLLKRLAFLADNPLANDWDGVWNLSSK